MLILTISSLKYRTPNQINAKCLSDNFFLKVYRRSVYAEQSTQSAQIDPMGRFQNMGFQRFKVQVF